MATSDEQRFAMALDYFDANLSDSDLDRRSFAEGWMRAAQQAPQERADQALLQRCRYEIASLHDIYHDEMTYVPKALARLIQDIDAALAANPQQSIGESE